jgi:2-hydroxy-3-oxopropionate reductase
VQLADNPGRNEPGTGEINYRYLFESWRGRLRRLDRLRVQARTTAPKQAWAGAQRMASDWRLTTSHTKENIMSRVGFIGLGIMGAPMAQHLQAGGHKLYLHDIKNPPFHLIEGGATVCTSAAEVAARADIIIIMVPDTPHVEDALFGEEGVAKGLRPGKIVVDMSSISPIETKAFAKKINALGCEYLDAPVSGGEVGRQGGLADHHGRRFGRAFEIVKPLFELMGKNITLVGGNGDGQTTKVANQIIVALNIQAVAEALLFASKAGADPAKVREALMGGFANSRILEVHGERMVKRTFNPGFRIELHQKDLNLALQGAKAMGVSLPNTAMAQELMNACAPTAERHSDHSACAAPLSRASCPTTDAEAGVGHAAGDVGRHRRVGEFGAIETVDGRRRHALVIEQQFKQEACAGAGLAVHKAHSWPGQVGQRAYLLRIALGDKDALRAECQVNQHVARRVQPWQVFGRSRSLEVAHRQVEAGQVAFAARQRRHGLGAAAVLQIDQQVLLLQLVDQRRHRETVRGGQPQGRWTYVEQADQLLL